MGAKSGAYCVFHSLVGCILHNYIVVSQNTVVAECRSSQIYVRAECSYNFGEGSDIGAGLERHYAICLPVLSNKTSNRAVVVK